MIKIHNLSSTLNLATCYMVPGRSVSRIEWSQFFSSLSTHDLSLIFGHFNSHHTSWNCSNIDTNRIKLLNNSDLILVNQNRHIHIDFHVNSLSDIDLVLCSSVIYDLIKFNVLEDSWGSNHFIIIVNLLVGKTPKTTATVFLPPKKLIGSNIIP